MNSITKLPRVAPDSLLASLLLAFLASAGLYYVNIMPALVEGLKVGLHFSDRQAGLAGSANVYGAACGALIATALVTRLAWRPTAIALLFVLMTVDACSILVQSPQTMIVVRALHGLAGGMLVGFAFSVIARTRQPERTFGMLLVVQDGLGGLGVILLPQLVPSLGTKILFFSLIGFSVITLLMVPFLDAYPRKDFAALTRKKSAPTQWLPLTLAMLSVFLFQFANMLLFAYIISLAKHFSLDALRAAAIVGISAWVGIIGSILVIVIATHFGRVRSLAIALLLTALGMWLLHYSANAGFYAIANCGTAITWSFGIPYLLGMCAKFDSTGRAAALGGFASKMGLASGPLLGALLVGNDQYQLLINIAVGAIIICALTALVPALLLDRADDENRSIKLATQSTRL